jgi:hypothetical protein
MSVIGVASVVGGLFKSWLDRKNRVAEAKTEAQIVNAGKVIDGSGLKDEFVLLVWSIPAIMSFVPGAQEYSVAGFENLSEAPEWYIVGWVSICLAIYGIKPAAKKIVQWKESKAA